MFILLIGLLALVLVAGIVVSIIFSKGKFRIYVIAFNVALILAWLTVFIIYQNDVLNEEEESYEYVITKGDVFSGIRYAGEIDGYEVVRFTGLADEYPYAVPKDMVKVSGICNVYKTVKFYSAHDKSIVYGGENPIRQLSDGTAAYYSENILMIKPDYSDLVFYSGFFGAILMLIHSVVCAVIVLNGRSKVKKQNIV